MASETIHAFLMRGGRGRGRGEGGTQKCAPSVTDCWRGWVIYWMNDYVVFEKESQNVH